MKKQKSKKQIIYSILAVIVIVIGVYLDLTGESGADESSTSKETVTYVAGSESGEAGSEVTGESQVQTESQVVIETTENPEESEALPEDYVAYYFRNDNLLEQHYEKHGIEMGFDSMEEYEAAACAVIYNPDVLTKTEKEDGDYVYYVEETNEFVILSPDGYIRTYFNPNAGIDYFNRQ